MPDPELSVVTTLYNSSPYIDEFFERLAKVVPEITDSFEIIFVNDGSPDDALERAVGLHRRDPRVCVVDLSRNFGHHQAILAGLDHARGDRVFLIDVDLEEAPELLGKFHQVMMEKQADVVYGIQEHRKGGLFERVSGWMFFRIFNWLSRHPVPPNLLTVRLMTQRYVEGLLQHTERAIYLGGLWTITGFRQVAVPVVKNATSPSTYTLRKKISILVDAITSFSSKPLTLVFYLGAGIVLVSVLAASYLIVRALTSSDFFLVGWPSLIVSIWLLGGLSIFAVGLVGIYLSRVFIEAKSRPTIVADVYQREEL